jgi:hypothetical protein
MKKDEVTGYVMRMTEKKNTLSVWWRSLKDAGPWKTYGEG